MREERVKIRIRVLDMFLMVRCEDLLLRDKFEDSEY